MRQGGPGASRSRRLPCLTATHCCNQVATDKALAQAAQKKREEQEAAAREQEVEEEALRIVNNIQKFVEKFDVGAPAFARCVQGARDRKPGGDNAMQVLLAPALRASSHCRILARAYVAGQVVSWTTDTRLQAQASSTCEPCGFFLLDRLHSPAGVHR